MVRKYEKFYYVTVPIKCNTDIKKSETIRVNKTFFTRSFIIDYRSVVMEQSLIEENIPYTISRRKLTQPHFETLRCQYYVGSKKILLLGEKSNFKYLKLNWDEQYQFYIEYRLRKLIKNT